ncbi:uncharacterized protein DS421_20g688970 [Arachis hypogaea]|nr:uncharacterized protein DS421_20g688970 [Arachis hypogaea]
MSIINSLLASISTTKSAIEHKGTSSAYPKREDWIDHERGTSGPRAEREGARGHGLAAETDIFLPTMTTTETGDGYGNAKASGTDMEEKNQDDASFRGDGLYEWFSSRERIRIMVVVVASLI